MFEKKDSVRATLYVVSSIFNSQRYETRWKHHMEFVKRIIDAGAVMITVEAVFEDRQPVIVSLGENHIVVPIKVHNDSEIWLKENLLNIGISKLPEDWKYVACIDDDIQFVNFNWVDETINLLQHYDVIQMFSEALDLDRNFNPYQKNYGSIYEHLNEGNFSGKGYFKVGREVHDHCGYAWAYTRHAIETLGGLIDYSIIGSADRLMCDALMGNVLKNSPKYLHPQYISMLKSWEERALELKKNIGYMEGSILHFFHGDKKNRQYDSRWKILVRNRFNPLRDIRKDWNGVIRLNSNKPNLLLEIRNYFGKRKEDE